MPSVVQRVCRPQLHQRNVTGRTRGTPQQSRQPFCFVFFSDRGLCVCLFLDLQRDILCKSNVFDYICALDAISAQSYSVFLRLFIKRTSQATKWLQQLFATLLAAVFVSSGQPMKKIATQHRIASCSLSAASSKIWLFRLLEIRHQTIRPLSLTLPMLR